MILHSEYIKIDTIRIRWTSLDSYAEAYRNGRPVFILTISGQEHGISHLSADDVADLLKWLDSLVPGNTDSVRVAEPLEWMPKSNG